MLSILSMGQSKTLMRILMLLGLFTMLQMITL